MTPLTDYERDQPVKPTEAVEPKNIAEACIAVLNTPPFVLVSVYFLLFVGTYFFGDRIVHSIENTIDKDW